MAGEVNSYRDLVAWQKAIVMVDRVYDVCDAFPKHELYGLGSQTRRSTVSVPANLAEGSTRGRKEFLHFIAIARGSLAETETHLIIAQPRQYITKEQLEELLKLTNELSRILMGLLKSLKRTD